MFVKNQIAVDKAVLLEVSDDVIVDRIKGRAEAEGRADDTEEVVRNRLAVYNEQTAPLVEFYRSESVLTPIKGEDTMDGVFNSIMEALK